MDPAVARLIQPNWMPDPDSWVWHRPDGVEQGFGRLWRVNPGLANLLWLALQMDRPPDVYDGRTNADYMGMLLQGNLRFLANDPTIEELATLLSLKGFARQMSRYRSIGGDKLYKLAAARIHAHT